MGCAPPAVRYERVRPAHAEGARGSAHEPRVALDLLRCAGPAPKRRKPAEPAQPEAAADGGAGAEDDVYDLYEEWRQGDEGPRAPDAPDATWGAGSWGAGSAPLAELFWEERSDGEPDEFGWDEHDDGADSDSNGEARRPRLFPRARPPTKARERIRRRRVCARRSTTLRTRRASGWAPTTPMTTTCTSSAYI